MRSFILGLAILASTGLAGAQKSIRQVDFKNFSYPLSSHLLGHANLQWLDTTQTGSIKGQAIHMVNGRDTAGFTLQSVDYTDLTGDGKDEAVVVVRYNAGGTQNTHYVYMYSMAEGHPRLLAYCHTGGGTSLGLHKAYGAKGQLVIEMIEGQSVAGNCCTPGVMRMRYDWRNGGFQIAGTPEHATLKQP